MINQKRGCSPLEVRQSLEIDLLARALPQVRRTRGCASVDDVTERDVCHRLRLSLLPLEYRYFQRSYRKNT